MLTQAENERLSRVGPDTPGGKLLRRYWKFDVRGRCIEQPNEPPSSNT